MDEEELPGHAESALGADVRGEAPEVEQTRQLLSALPLALTPLEAPRDLRSLLLEAVASDDPVVRFAGFVGRFSRVFDVPSERAREILASIASSASWEAYVPGVSALHFEAGPAVAGADTGLVTFAAGMSYPRHTHVGEETMFILQGGIADDVTGKESVAGDIVVMAARTSHAFTILPEEDCVAAVVLYGGYPIFESGAPSSQA